MSGCPATVNWLFYRIAGVSSARLQQQWFYFRGPSAEEAEEQVKKARTKSLLRAIIDRTADGEKQPVAATSGLQTLLRRLAHQRKRSPVAMAVNYRFPAAVDIPRLGVVHGVVCVVKDGGIRVLTTDELAEIENCPEACSVYIAYMTKAAMQAAGFDVDRVPAATHVTTPADEASGSDVTLQAVAGLLRAAGGSLRVPANVVSKSAASLICRMDDDTGEWVISLGEIGE